MEFLDTVIGAVLALAAVAVAPRLRRAKGPTEPKPFCGCEHHFSMHDPETGQCHAVVGWQWVTERGQRTQVKRSTTCTCRRYTGPEPLPEYFP